MTKNKVIDILNKIRKAEQKAIKNGNKNPYGFISDVSGKIFVF